MPIDRDALERRIKAVAAKTVKNGCTKAEAEAATAMLAKLRAKYPDVEIRREQQPHIQKPPPAPTRPWHASYSYLARARQIPWPWFPVIVPLCWGLD